MGWKRKRKIKSSLVLLRLGFCWYCISMGAAGSGGEGRRTSHFVRSSPSISSAGPSAFSFNPMAGGIIARPSRLSEGNRESQVCFRRQNQLRKGEREPQRRRCRGAVRSGTGAQSLDMGVRGLTGYVDKNLRGAAPVQEIHEGDTLAIDGSGWVFQVLEGQRVDHGGDYDLLHEATLREVSKLRQAGVKLKVFLDGRRRKMKATTRERRRESAAESLARLYGYTLDGGGAFVGGDAKGPDRSVASFPVPKMASRQFAASLMSAGVEVIECPGEADQEVAKASAEDPTGRTFAVGSDSDFFIFERCRYVRFDWLKMSSEGRLKARVWTRARLAELCGITEEQVVEWALLMGNDYTEGLLLGKMGAARRANGRPEKTLEWVKAQGPEFRLGPRTTAAALLSSPSWTSGSGEYDYAATVDVEADLDAEGNLPEAFSSIAALDAGFSSTSGASSRRRLPTGTPLCVDVVGLGEDDMVEEEEEEEEEDFEEAKEKHGSGDKGDSVPGAFQREKSEEEMAVELALEFSRALYSLQSLDRFPDDEEEGTAVDEAVTVEEETGGVGVPPPRGVVGPKAISEDDPGLPGANRRTRRLMERKTPWRKGDEDSLSGGGDRGEGGSGEGFFGGMGTEQRRQEASSKPARVLTLETRESNLRAQLLRLPFGDAALEALQLTLEQTEENYGAVGGTSSAAADGAGVRDRVGVGSGGMSAGAGVVSDKQELNDVEAGARRAALWSVALGVRKDFPDDVRVKWRDVLLAIRYQENLLEAYSSRGFDRTAAFSAISENLSSSSAAAADFEAKVCGEDGKYLKVPMPLEHFHGPTFHALLNEYRATNGKGVGGEVQAGREGPGIDPTTAFLDDSNPFESTGAGEGGTDKIHVPDDSSSGGGGVGMSAPSPLPIDAHREEILAHVRNNRVTVIHGETGSGKSSRLPMMLVEDALEHGRGGGGGGGPRPRMFVSQPRRAAARALAQRVREESERLGMKLGVAMRLGHGVREGPPKAEVTFATTGYIVRLIANNPGLLDSHTHLIIDEVHERSVDTDLLCFFAKQLLRTHPTLRLIVMSATMSATLVSNYYGMADLPLFVGAKRFPIREVYVDDLADELSYRMVMRKTCASLVQATSTLDSTPTPQILTIQHSLAVQVARAVGSPGSAVLIFVPGMASILAIIELFELISSADVVYKVIPFHSELPKEEMMSAFEPAEGGVVKVVVATNSAESSITLPDVDNVVCLGSCKQMMFDDRTQRCTLTPVWISKASAVQRAGRTGRVRPGTVYRLYSRRMGEELMSEHGDSEIKRLPLDSLVLELKNMLADSPVVPVLESTLEPPDLASVQRSLESLYAMGFLSSPDDEGSVLTDTGRFASGLGVDLHLGRMVALGARLGVLTEAASMAAVLSATSTPFRKASHMVHGDPDEYNGIVGRSFMSQSVFDRGLYSDTFSVLRLLREYIVRVKMGSVPKGRFCRLFHLSYPRMDQLAASAESIGRRVMALNDEPFQMVPRDPTADPDLANILRLLLAWTFPRNLIKLRTRTPYATAAAASGGATTDKSQPMELFLQGHAVSADQLDTLLPRVYPGMKEISWQCSGAVYTHAYQAPNRARLPPDAMASKLWHVAHSLLPLAPSGQDRRQGGNKNANDERGGGRGAHGKERGGQKAPLNGDGGVEAGDVNGDEVDDGVLGRVGAGAAVREADAAGSGAAADSRDGDALSALQGSRTRGGERGMSVAGEKGEGSAAGFADTEEEKGDGTVPVPAPGDLDRDAAASDAVVGLVYTVTRITNTMAWESWRGKDWDVSRKQPPVGERRVCLVMTERFATANWQQLSLWGIKGHDKIARHLVNREHVEGVGYVLVLDVQHAPELTKRLRGFIAQRAGGVYAVTDSPMVQVEFSGAREPPVDIDILPEVFGVETSFEGGRTGTANQVIRFERKSNHAGECSPLVDDVPLGARLLVAMANGSRQRKLRLWSDPETRVEKVDVALSIPRNIWLPHDVSPAPFWSSSSTYKPGNGGDQKSKVDSRDARVVLPARKRKGFVFAPPFSVAASVVYQGDDRDVFAVASTITHLPQANAVSDGLTLLPPGLSWLSRALLCSGTALEDLPSGHGLKEEQIDGASKFAKEFWPGCLQEGCDDANYFRASLREVFEQEIGPGTEKAPKKSKEAFVNVNGDKAPPQEPNVELRNGHLESNGAGVERRRKRTSLGVSAGESGGHGQRRAVDDGLEGPAFHSTPVGRSPPRRTFPADSLRSPGIDTTFESYQWSPLASMRVDEVLWGGEDVASTDVLWDAAAAARTTSSVASTASAALSTTDHAKPLPKKMNPELGRSLMEWSDSLQASGRKMAALMAFQAVVMGVMSVHRRNVLAGCEEIILIGGAEGGASGGGFLYGNVSRLQADILAATGVDSAVSKSAARAFGDTYAGFGDGFENDGVLSVLRGVPWLSVVHEGKFAWLPPGSVAAALDTSDPEDPTDWMTGIGDGVEAVGDEERRRRRGWRERRHPCLQQFEAYFSHRDDVDFAAALSEAGLFRSALLVVSRIVLSAAVPEGAMGTALLGTWRNPRTQALRGRGSPPLAERMEEAGRRRDRMAGDPALVHRFEELAGFLVGGPSGYLSPAGLSSAFDCVADSTPELYEMGYGGRRRQQKQQRQRKEDTSKEDPLGKGSCCCGGALPSTEPGSSVGHVDLGSVVGAPTAVSLSPSPLPQLLGGNRDVGRLSDAIGEWRGESMLAGAGTRDDGVTGGVTRGSGAVAPRAGSGRLVSAGLDSDLIVAFSPRFEAARVLVDLLGLQQGRGSVTVDGGVGQEQEGRRDDKSRSGSTRQRRQRVPFLARGVEVRGGVALLVVAAIKRLQDARDELCGGNAPPDQRGITFDALRDELDDLCGCQLDALTVLEGVRAAPGVVVEGQGDRAEYFWAFDSGIVQDLIVDTGEGRSEREVAELRDFLARAFDLRAPAAREGAPPRNMARKNTPLLKKKGPGSRSKVRRRGTALLQAAEARAFPSGKKRPPHLNKPPKDADESSARRDLGYVPLPSLPSTFAAAATPMAASDVKVAQALVTPRAPTRAGGKGAVVGGRGGAEETSRKTRKPSERHTVGRT